MRLPSSGWGPRASRRRRSGSWTLIVPGATLTTGMAKGLEGMARVAEARGRALDAQRLLAAAAAWREERGMTFEQALGFPREHVDLQKGT